MDVPDGGFFYSVRKFYEGALRLVTLSSRKAHHLSAR